MAEGVAARGHTVHVVATDAEGAGHLQVPLEQPLVEKGVTYRYFRRQSTFYTFSWPLTRWLAEHINEYDVVHIHALFSYASLPAAFYATRQNVPYIVRPLGTLNRWGMQQRRPWLKQLSFQLVERHILARAAMLHFTSEDERQQASEVGVRVPSTVLPLGIQLDPFDRCLRLSAS